MKRYDAETYRELIQDSAHFKQTLLWNFMDAELDDYKTQLLNELRCDAASLERIRYVQGVLDGLERVRVIAENLHSIAKRGYERSLKENEDA